MQLHGDSVLRGTPSREGWSTNPPAISTTRPEMLALTRREQEVLNLLRDRLTDREIADSLSIGVRTAESHVARVRAKLGAPNRREAMVVAVRLGLA